MKSIGNDQAFPHSDGTLSNNSTGLTKLEYFAGLALQGIIANKHKKTGTTNEQYAAVSVDIAKALIAELEKESP